MLACEYGKLAHAYNGEYNEERAHSMANWCIWRTDYGKSTVANRHMLNWHMAKWRHIGMVSAKFGKVLMRCSRMTMEYLFYVYTDVHAKNLIAHGSIGRPGNNLLE